MAKLEIVVVDGIEYHVSDEEIPTGARYVATEECPRRLVIYQKYVSGTLGSNPRLIVAPLLTQA